MHIVIGYRCILHKLQQPGGSGGYCMDRGRGRHHHHQHMQWSRHNRTAWMGPIRMPGWRRARTRCWRT